MNKQTKTELAFAFSQMYEEHLQMVPQELLAEISHDIDAELFAKFDPNKPFTEQDLCEETLEILATIFKDKFN